MRRRTWTLLVPALLVSACGVLVPGKVVSIGDVAWQSDTVLLYVAEQEGPDEVRTVAADAQPGPRDPQVPGLAPVCPPSDYGLRTLPGGKVAVSVHCSGGTGTELFEHDGHGTPWGEPQRGRVTGQWTGDGGYGMTYGSSHCKTLVRLGKPGAALSVPALPDPVRVFEPQLPPCAGARANAAWPMPHGQGVDFLVAPASGGLDGEARRLSPWTLFRADGAGTVTAVLTGFVDVRGAALSGDARTAVVAAERDGVRALWAVDMPGGAVRKLADGFFGSVSFAPDGRRLAAVVLRGAWNDEIRVL